MKKILSIIIVGALILGLTSCNKDKSQIKTAVTSFFTALNHKDTQSARLYATKESGDFINMLQQTIFANPDPNMNPDQNFLLSNVKIDGDVATANIRGETQSKPLTVMLKKENGTWKVSLDSKGVATLLGIDGSKGGWELNPPLSALGSDGSADSNQQSQNTGPTAPGQTLNLSDTSVTPVGK